MSPLALLLPLELPRQLSLSLLQLFSSEPAAHVPLQRQHGDGHLRLQPLVVAAAEPGASACLHENYFSDLITNCNNPLNSLE